jgi:HEAT repeat protein/V8-like Glu-specific endopeptidase
MTLKGLYNNNDCRYDFHRLQDLNLPLDFAKTLKEQAQKVACLVHQKYLTKRDEGWGFTEDVPTLADQQEMMLNAIFGEKEAFRNQFTPGFGTAFLVTNQLALTAAHCFVPKDSTEFDPHIVEAAKLVFGFHAVYENRSGYFFTEEQVHTVTVVAYQYFRASGRNTAYSEWTDWALLKLEREVACDPLPLNLNKVVDKIELYMLGHPNGLPLKFTYNGKVEKNTESGFFECHLDAFAGNSGSPVLNRGSQRVEGILIEGSEDYQVVLDYRRTGQKRIQASSITRSKIFSNQIGKRMENCQRLDILRHLIDQDLLDLKDSELVHDASSIILNSLKECYKSRSFITRLLDDPLPIDTIYTELVLLCNNKEKEQEKEKEKQAFEEHRINSWEDIQATKEPIQIDALFETRDGKTPKKLLILGRAGIGKSTLCQYMANQWAEGKLWKGKFDALFWVPLRKLQNVHSAETAASVLFRLCCQDKDNSLFTRDVREYLKNNPERILLVLDGLDEMTLAEDSQQKKILDELLKFPHWILTSRPHAAGSIVAGADATIENLGYASKTIDLYIQKSFQDDAQAVIQKVRQNPIIFGLCHIPINLELICAILKKSNGDLSKITSMTSLYEELTLTLQRRFLEKIGKPEAWNWTPIGVSLELKSVFELLEVIAWTAMQERQLVFSLDSQKMEKLGHSFLSLEENLRHICIGGFLQSSQDGESEDVFAKEYSFLHLTFQEFFAARYLARLVQCNRDEAASVIWKVKFDARYKVVMWFVAGLLRNEGGDFWNLNVFFEMLDTPKDLVGLYGTLLKVRCLEECGWQKKLQKIKFYEEEISFWLEKMEMTGWGGPIKKYLMETFEISPQVVRKLFIPKLISCLSSWNTDFRIAAAEALGQIVGYADPQAVIPPLLETLRVKDHSLTQNLRYKYGDLKKAAAQALGQVGHADPQAVIPALLEMIILEDTYTVGHHKASIEALNQVGQTDPMPVIFPLLKALKDRNSWIRNAAATALGQIGQADPQIVIPALLHALKDEYHVIRAAAAEALGKIGHVDPHAVILSLFKAALKDDEKKVREAATKALGKLGQDNPKAVILQMLELLKDGDNCVRKVAAEALGKIGHVDPHAVIPPLLMARIDKDDGINVSAYRALGHMCQADPQTIIPALFEAFKDKDAFVRQSAAEALGQVGHADPHAVIPALLHALKDEYNEVRKSAAKSLGEVGHADLQFVIPALLQALKDEDLYVKIATANTLGEVGHINPQAVISALLENLKDQNSLSRYALVKALGRIGHVNPQTVIPALFEAFKDKDAFVRNAVVEALGRIGHVNPQAVIPALIKALRVKESAIRTTATVALGQIGHVDSEVVIPVLLKLLRDKESAITKTATVAALGQIGHTVPQAVIPALIQALKDENKWVRNAVVEALGRIGHVNPQAVIPALLEAFKEEDWDVKKAALYALGQVGQADPLAGIPALLEAFKDEGWDFRESTTVVLRKYDLSSYLKSHIYVLDPPDPFEDWKKTLLTSTPLTSLISCYNKDPSQSYIYSAAITKKCIEENLPIFLIKNALYFYEQSKLCTIDLPDPHPLTTQIEKRVPQYPEFSDGICTIQ